MKPSRSIIFKQWRMPMLLALATALGLLSALISAGDIWRMLSWALLSIPLFVIVYHAFSLKRHVR